MALALRYVQSANWFELLRVPRTALAAAIGGNKFTAMTVYVLVVF